MSEFIKIIGIGVVSVICYLLIKPIKPELAIFVGLAGSCIILISCVDMLMEIISNLSSFVERAGIGGEIFALVLKIVGVGYLTEFSANLCTDVGGSSVADKIVFAGKIFILFMSLPIISNLLEIIMGLLP